MERILCRLTEGLLSRSWVAPDTCVTCHKERVTLEGERYCGKECKEFYLSLLLPMGQKRAPELLVDEQQEERRRLEYFESLLDSVDDPILAKIIVFTYPDYAQSLRDMVSILALRLEGARLRGLIDLYILRDISLLSEDITSLLENKDLALFTGLRTFALDKDDINITSVSLLSNLTDLTIGQSIGDDSFSTLSHLQVLKILGNPSLSQGVLLPLTHLHTLYISENDQLGRNFFRTGLPSSLEKLLINRCPLVDNYGIEDLHNLKELRLVGVEGVSDQGLRNLTNLEVLVLEENQAFEGDVTSLHHMTRLTHLSAYQCPNFRGDGFYRHSRMKVLDAALTSLSDTALYPLLNLTSLHCVETRITGASLSRLIHLEILVLGENLRVQDGALAALKNLKQLDLHSNTQITRKSLSLLTNLEALVLDYTKMTGQKGVPWKLPNLTLLSLKDTKAIRAFDMKYFTSLTYLDLTDNTEINGRVNLRNQTSLLKLDLTRNQMIKNSDMVIFRQLEWLNLTENTVIESDSLAGLSKLNSIILYDGSVTNDYLLVDEVRRETM